MSDTMIVELIETMPTSNLETAIVLAARTSYGKSTETPEKDQALLRYLFNNHHTSVFEMVKFKFKLRVPIFVARQILRHRTANVNEFSERYATAKHEFFHPSKREDGIRLSTKSTNKQSSDKGLISPALKQKVEEVEAKLRTLFADYDELLSLGMAKECARFCLPVSTYTELIFCIDLNNFIKFLRLRMDEHAQLETRKVATQMFDLVKDMIPITASCLLEERDKVWLTKEEIRGLIMNNKNLEFKSKSAQSKYLSLFNQ